jgi:hypothetical protein
MLAYAFLVVAAATQHARHPPPLGLIPLTCNEIQHLFAPLARQLPATVGTGCAGRAGDAASKPALVPAYRRQAAQQPFRRSPSPVGALGEAL